MWNDLRPGDELVERNGDLMRHFLVLAREGNVLFLYSFQLDELLSNDIEDIHPDDLDRFDEMYMLTRHV